MEEQGCRIVDNRQGVGKIAPNSNTVDDLPCRCLNSHDLLEP